MQRIFLIVHNFSFILCSCLHYLPLKTAIAFRFTWAPMTKFQQQRSYSVFSTMANSVLYQGTRIFVHCISHYSISVVPVLFADITAKSWKWSNWNRCRIMIVYRWPNGTLNNRMWRKTERMRWKQVRVKNNWTFSEGVTYTLSQITCMRSCACANKNQQQTNSVEMS